MTSLLSDLRFYHSKRNRQDFLRLPHGQSPGRHPVLLIDGVFNAGSLSSVTAAPAVRLWKTFRSKPNAIPAGEPWHVPERQGTYPRHRSLHPREQPAAKAVCLDSHRGISASFNRPTLFLMIF